MLLLLKNYNKSTVNVQAKPVNHLKAKVTNLTKFSREK